MNALIHSLFEAVLDEGWPAWYSTTRLVLCDALDDEGETERALRLRNLQNGIIYLGDGNRLANGAEQYQLADLVTVVRETLKITMTINGIFFGAWTTTHQVNRHFPPGWIDSGYGGFRLQRGHIVRIRLEGSYETWVRNAPIIHLTTRIDEDRDYLHNHQWSMADENRLLRHLLVEVNRILFDSDVLYLRDELWGRGVGQGDMFRWY